MDCLRQRWVQGEICITKALSARPLFHLWNSTLWLLSTREYLWWRGLRLSHSGSVARQMLAFEAETLRDWHAPLGWRGEQIILTNMHEIHPPSDNLFSRGKLWARQTRCEYSLFSLIKKKAGSLGTDPFFFNIHIWHLLKNQRGFFFFSTQPGERRTIATLWPRIAFQHPSEGVESNLWISVLILLAFPVASQGVSWLGCQFRIN